jgi:tetratricopeptide (TPR) repeat protein
VENAQTASEVGTVLRCACGNVVDLTRFEPGETFACPACRQAHVTPGTAVSATAETRVRVAGTEGLDEQMNVLVSRSGLPPGTRLGHYLIERELGRGGMGVVYLARDEALKREVALKLLPAVLALSPEIREWFRTEARAAASIKHPNIAVIYAMEEQENSVYFAMEYVEGETLAQMIVREGTIDPLRALEIASAVAEGLRAGLLQGVIHRDIKPANIMIDPEGRPKVTDFGLARIGAVGMEVGAKGAVLGTPEYMAPEQGRGGEVDHRADLYALGATIYEMVAGHPPFDGANPIEIILAHTNRPIPPVAELPLATDRIMRWLMEKEPARRPATYDELIDALDAARSELRSGGGAHAVLAADEPAEADGLDSILRSQLVLARANVAMARYQKAERIYVKLLEQKGPIRLEAAFQLGELYERQDCPTEAAAHWQIIIDESGNPNEVTYARWKLGNQFERQAAETNEEAIRVYRAILEEEDNPFPKALLEARIRSLEDSIQTVKNEMSSSSVRLERKRE